LAFFDDKRLGKAVVRLNTEDEKVPIQARQGGLDPSVSVEDLLKKAAQNEHILRRYQQFELNMLELGDLQSLLDMLLLDSLDYFQLDWAELWLYDPQNTLQELLPENYARPAGLQFLSTTGAIEKVHVSPGGVQLVTIPALKTLAVFNGRQVRSAALLPLVRQGVVVGSLHFGARGHQRFTPEKSTDFIAHLASIAAACLENVVNQERLQRLSLYDVLTKVKNRRAFHQSLDEEVSRSARNGDPLSLLFVDLDKFKHVNDSYGHPMGDKVLAVVAQLMRELLRKTDHVCRYGGEEFALILPNCDQTLALEIAERLRVEVAALAIDKDLDADGPAATVAITLSLGVCCWQPLLSAPVPAERDVVRDLVVYSDRGVYQSKSAGRNCIHYVSFDCDDLEPQRYSVESC